MDEYGINDENEIIVVEKNDINQINEILKTNQNSSNSKKISIPENKQNLISLRFYSPSRASSFLTFNRKDTISDALGKYCQSLGLVLKKAQSLAFLFNGSKLSINDERFLGDVFDNLSIITVIDQGGIIGA